MDDALRKAAQPEQQAKPVADELGWLIEMRPSENLLWWDGGFDVSDDYPSKRLFARMVNDVNKAVRFSRREDAQCVLDAMLAVRPSPLFARASTLYSVQEHMWIAAQPQQAAAPAWMLPGEVAQRIGNEHRVSAAVIQDISHALHKMATQPQQAAAPKGE